MKKYELMTKEQIIDIISGDLDCERCPMRETDCSDYIGWEFEDCGDLVRQWLNSDVDSTFADIIAQHHTEEEPKESTFDEMLMKDAKNEIMDTLISAVAKELVKEALASMKK